MIEAFIDVFIFFLPVIAVIIILSFILWIYAHFNGQNFRRQL